MLTWWWIWCRRHRLRSTVVPETVAVVCEAGSGFCGYHSCSRSDTSPVVGRRQVLRMRMMVTVHVMSCGRRVRRIVAPALRREALMARGDRRVGGRPGRGGRRRWHAAVLVVGGSVAACRGGGWRPEGQACGRLPRRVSRRRVRQVVVGGCVGVLVVIEPGRWLEGPRAASVVAVGHRRVVPRLGAVVWVPDDTWFAALAVRRGQTFGRNVQRAGGAVVARHRRAGRRRRGGGRGGGGGCRHRGSRCRTRHAAVADGRGSVLWRWLLLLLLLEAGVVGGWEWYDGWWRRGTLLVEAAVHHRPPSHPGGIPRAGGWRRDAAVPGHRIVVQRSGRARSHVVRDGDDGDGWRTWGASAGYTRRWWSPGVVGSGGGDGWQ